MDSTARRPAMVPAGRPREPASGENANRNATNAVASKSSEMVLRGLLSNSEDLVGVLDGI